MGKIFGISDILNAVFNRDANKLKVETDLQIDAVTVADVTIHDAVATDNKLKVNEDGSVPVELTGSNVGLEVVPVTFEGATFKEIRDTGTYTTDKIDTKKYKSISVYVANTLGTEIILYPLMPMIYTGGSRGLMRVYDGDKWIVVDATKIPGTAGYVYLLNTAIPELENRAFQQISFQLKAPTAPTAGSVAIWLEGVPNC